MSFNLLTAPADAPTPCTAVCLYRSKRLEERIKNYEKQGEQCKANVAKLQQQARGQ